jgi:hypothetical protein
MIATPQDANGRSRSGFAERAVDAAVAAQASPDHEPKTPHPLDPLLEQVAEVRTFALHYVEAQTDTVRAAARRTLIKAAAGLGAAIVALTFVIACTLMLAEGLAELISLAAGGRPWVGNLALGGGVLVILGVAAAICIRRQLRASREQTIRKYENRHYAQRAKFGADVTQRAAT